ncbi:MAG: transglutaminase domain-containing protein, partial [Dokdonella sp.]
MPRCHALLLVLLAQVAIASPSASLDLVIASIDQGQFKQAQTMIDAGLAQTSLAEETRTSFEFQRERMRRILIDFTLDADALKAAVRKRIPDLADDEFARWDALGLFE